MISVGITTIGRTEMLNSVLVPLIYSDLVNEIVILDEAAVPVTESYQVNQALDLLSLKGKEVRIIRNRNRNGIGAARLKLAKECRYDWVMMIDDDVVLEPDCIDTLYAVSGDHPWYVPSCILVPNLGLDGYTVDPIDRYDERVTRWVDKYPWFLPYFNYVDDFVENIKASGTQAILLKKSVFLRKCEPMKDFGPIPREDTYMTKMMGEGCFVSRAKCYHFEHNKQQDRHWDKSMFYRLHEKIIENPKKWEEFIK